MQIYLAGTMLRATIPAVRLEDEGMSATKQWSAEARVHESDEAAGRPVIDLDHLRGCTMDDAGLERELLGIFRDQMGEHLGGLRQAKSPQDWKFAAHTLKGAARALGATRVADTSEALEDLGYEAGAEDKSRLLSRLEDDIAACEEAICALID